MYNFKDYYNARDGKELIRTVRKELKKYLIHMEKEDESWADFRNHIKDIYYTLTSPLEPKILGQELTQKIFQLQQMEMDDRIQSEVRLSIINILKKQI